jgi:hypothetical protein
MPNLPPTLGNYELSSLWDGLSPYLIASFYEVVNTRVKDAQGRERWDRTKGSDPVTVFAPLTEANMEMALNWQSPFEQAGPESKAPALMAMLQSGAIQPMVDALTPNFLKQDKAGPDQNAIETSDRFLSQFEGRTGITKLNSTQVFNGMPPVKIQVTALFRAWRDPAGEVEAPVDKLMAWALTVKLSNDASLLARAVQALKGEMDYVEALMPSQSPTRIAMQYKGRTYSPLVIESIGMPINSPIDANSRYVELVVPMTLCTLTALDRQDWSNTRVNFDGSC